MESIRRYIENQVISLTGLALGEVDFENPRNDPGLFGPDTACWQVHSDFSAMLIGGIGALLTQMLHPLALAGVWDHSNFRQDILGRLRRTAQFISGTTYGSRRDADMLIDRVNTIHVRVNGQAPDGRPYSARDPALLTWVHIAEVSSFLRAYLRYVDPDFPQSEQDRYYREIAQIARRLGASGIPDSCRAVADYIDEMRPQLECSERTREIMRILFNAPSPSRLSRPVGMLMMQAGIDLLPEWVKTMLGLRLSPLQSRLIQSGLRPTTKMLRWAVRDGAANRARRRMGLPPMQR